MIPKRSREYSLSDAQLLDDSGDISLAQINNRFRREITNSSRLYFASCTRRVVESHFTTVFMTILTLYALFADDIRLLAFSINDDDYFFGLASSCMFFFLLEIVLATYSKPKYRLSFYFFLDIVATVSMVPDIGWIWDKITGTSNSSATGSGTNQIQHAGSASRTGARTSRLVRIVRLVRLIRMVKLYKSAKHAIDAVEDEDAVHTSMTIPKESKIGQKLSELTTRRVILLVLVLLILLPLFDLGFFTNSPTSWDYGVNLLQTSEGSETFLRAYERFLDYHNQDTRPLVFLSYQSNQMTTILNSSISINSLRFVETKYAITQDIVAIFDIRYDSRLQAALSICQTMFVCFALTLGAIYLTQDANTLVIVPIEKMIDKVQRLTKNPIALNDEKFSDVYDMEVENKKRPWWRRKKLVNPEMETAVLEKNILKIGALLALGFGEAGSHIIAANLSKGDHLDPLIHGNKTMAIFGFCDIRNFTDITEILQEGVMMFVNEIAKVVHHTVDQYLGAANLNIGDAFLLVWKIKPEYISLEDNELKLVSSTYLSNLADLSLISFLKIISQINRDPNLLKYRDNQSLLLRLPNYAVKLGFGLHVGWAIEGPIGSDFKIDASYLSPHVNLASRLEEATKVYGVSLVMSGMMHNILSQATKDLCRHIDTVVLKGTNIPMKLYTYDVEANFLRKPKLKEYSKTKSKMKRHKMQDALKSPDFHASALFTTSQKLRRLRRMVDPEFIRRFQRGIAAYEAGQWKESKKFIQEALRVNPYDQPSDNLLKYIESYGYQAPPDWPGYREFGER